MADAYGVFTFTKSDECRINYSLLADAMNNFVWDTSGGKWIFDDKDNSIFRSDYCSQYPTVFPTKYTVFHCYCDINNVDYKKSLAEMNNEDWNNVDESEEEDATLSDIRDATIPFLNSGWIEIAFCSNEKLRYVYFGKIRIHADGAAQRFSIISGPSVGSETQEENLVALNS